MNDTRRSWQRFGPPLMKAAPAALPRAKNLSASSRPLKYTPVEIDRLISEGLDDIDRGDTIDGEEAFRQIRALSAERRRRQP
jgi:hypothetical protein